MDAVPPELRPTKSGEALRKSVDMLTKWSFGLPKRESQEAKLSIGDIRNRIAGDSPPAGRTAGQTPSIVTTVSGEFILRRIVRSLPYPSAFTASREAGLSGRWQSEFSKDVGNLFSISFPTAMAESHSRVWRRSRVLAEKSVRFM